MVVRIALSLTVLGALFLGGAYYHASSRAKILESDLFNARETATARQAALTQAGAEHDKLQKQLMALDEDLGATKTRLTAAETAKIQLGREIRELHSKLTASEAHAAELENEVTTLKDALKVVSEQSASAESVANYQATIDRLKQELADLSSAVPPVPEVQPAGLLLTTSRGRSSSVVSVGPASAFVVINYGSAHGALPRQLIMIRRGTETVATALISDVRTNYSIAQVQPESLRGALHKGDSAVIAN